jgi:cell growth-regulating nucleolar protein
MFAQSCITEDQKYQGALYKNKKKKGGKGQQGYGNAPPPAPAPPTFPNYDDMVPAQAYVEDVPDDVLDGNSPDILPEAPTPPSAVPEPPLINVFDFLVESNTPAASQVNFFPNDDSQLVRYDYENDAYVDEDGYMVDDDNEAVVQYGDGPIPAAEAMQSPAQKKQKAEPKKDKKRKRLHVEINDQVMTDAPPVLHSGLTGGINRMMQFPPSPEFSGDNGEPPATPTKKTKHGRNKSSSNSKGTKHSRNRSESLGSNLLAMVSGNKTKKRKVSKRRSSTDSTTKRRGSDDKEKSEKPKLLEYKTGSRPSSRDGNDNKSNQMVLYQPRADLFLSMVTKGPESERGCSVNKALKRFHRERSESREGRAPSKTFDEKELWRSLRMRRNDRGEIVLFSLEDEEQ